MSLESREKINNKVEISLSQLTNLYLENYGDKELREIAIPSLIDNLTKVFDGQKVKMGGSAMEVVSGLIRPNEYWETKGQLKKIGEELPEHLIQGERSKLILSAIDTLGQGDPDFDFYVAKRELLEEIFQNIDKNNNRKISYGPVYPGSLFYRTHIQLIDNQEKSLFHIDITTLPETGDNQIQNRRHFIGDVHDNCRGKVSSGNGKITVEFNKEEMPKANRASKMKIENKDLKSTFESVFREMRKKTMHFASANNLKRGDFALSEIFPLMDIENIFSLREMTFGENSRTDELFERQNYYQKQILYQELFLMVQTDPYLTTIFLQDTGLDALFLGRHLARREVLALLSSEYLNFSPDNRDEKLNQRLRKSRENYLNLNGNDQKKTGLKRFISALGEVLGEDREKRDFEVHFRNGLEILGDPKNRVKKLSVLNPERVLNEKEEEILKQLNLGGGLTEKGLHHVLNEINPEKYPHQSEKDRKSFRKTLLELKKTGLIETAKRIIKTPKGEMEAWFYYPCLSSTKIEKVLFDAGRSKMETNLIKKAYASIGVDTLEAGLSIKTQELKESGVLDKIMSLFHPYLILKLITYQSGIEKRPKTHSYLDFQKRSNLDK